MPEQSYSKEFTVLANTEAVYKAITKEINKWWTIASNEAFNAGDILTVRFGEQPGFVTIRLIFWSIERQGNDDTQPHNPPNL